MLISRLFKGDIIGTQLRHDKGGSLTPYSILLTFCVGGKYKFSETCYELHRGVPYRSFMK